MLIIFFFIASFATFMFTIYNAKSGMFNVEDNNLLISMPIKPSIILGSRLIYIALGNLLAAMFIMGPAFIVYAKYVDVSFAYYILAFLTFIFLPIIPTILASIIGYIIAYLTSKSNAKNWAEIIISFIFIGLIYYGMIKIDVILNYVVTHIEDLENILKWGFYPFYLIEEIFNDYNYLSLAIYIFLNIGLFIIFAYLLSTNFKGIIARLQENKTKSNFVMKHLKTKSVSLTLYDKEVKRYLSSPIYVFNTSFGIIMLAIAAIASIFYDSEQIITMLGINSAGSTIFPLLVTGLMFIAFLSSTTSASISIERNNYWILKMLPVKPIEIFKGKIFLNLTLILPVTYISLLVFYFTFGLTISQLFILIIFVTIASLVSTKFGLLVNLKFPKMDAISDVVIVKRSLSVMIAILVPMFIIFGVSSFYSSIEEIINFNIFLIIIFALLIMINFIEYYLLKTWGAKRFKEIN
jgi:ABC-2 type transport system permease protein